MDRSGSEFGSEWIGADRSGVDRSVGRNSLGVDRNGSEWIGAISVGIRLEWIFPCFVSGVEWIGASLVSGSELGSSGCVEA